MKKIMKRLARKTLRHLDIGITRYSTLEKLYRNSSAAHDLQVLQRLNNGDAQQLLTYFNKSKSQIRQDLFVLSHAGFKRNGYFVEFGATNGIDLSNTYLLEKELNWTGILAEPARIWHKDLKRNRTCHIETSCVWKESNSTLDFNQVAEPELSTIINYSSLDSHKDARKEGRTYQVKTISLNDLLSKHNAPRHIDYLSIDTEGSEYEILSSFDFSRHTFGVITCEHNYTPVREQLHSLLAKQGYQRVHEDISLFDDWYIRSAATQP